MDAGVRVDSGTAQNIEKQKGCFGLVVPSDRMGFRGSNRESAILECRKRRAEILFSGYITKHLIQSCFCSVAIGSLTQSKSHLEWRSVLGVVLAYATPWKVCGKRTK